jgi:2-polyprenyl-3-methyl-5-hydroxy-6-metoxy-1,4-benzoquinol methylase
LAVLPHHPVSVKTAVAPCPICTADLQEALYTGPIRCGRFGTESERPETVWRCTSCGVACLPGDDIAYETDEYRRLVDGQADLEAFHRLHDAEQPSKVALLERVMPLRGKTVADIGCGGGSFLDLVRGQCAATIGIEPALQYRQGLVDKGHAVFSRVEDVDSRWRGGIDVAVCFSVIEHVPDPVGLLESVRDILSEDGVLLVSTPNRRDWLLELLPEDYGRFFYRRVHKWYFDADSLTTVARRAGFARVEPFHVHRFDLSNALLWLRDRRPTGLQKVAISPVLNATFREALVREGRSDYLYAWMSRDGRARDAGR